MLARAKSGSVPRDIKLNSFQALGVRARTLENLSRQQLLTPTPVQEQALPLLIEGRDCIIQSPTGSGKTLAFLIPLSEKLGGHQPSPPRALIITPTRELATQIGGVLNRLDPRLRVSLVFGGVGYQGQINQLRTADVIIGCPGRLVDMAQRGAARLGAVEYLVLDEADEMLDAGFAKDVEDLTERTNQRFTKVPRQTVLASATMPDWVSKMANRHLTNPGRVTVAPPEEADLEHGLISVARAQKVAYLSQLLQQSASTIVFHRTKHGARKLAHDLTLLGHATAELQGNLSQAARDRSIASFRKREAKVLVATNVAARGIDIKDVNLVVNFELPDTAQWLTHRVGRTARNGAKGRALTFLSEDDSDKWRKLRREGAPELRFVDPGRLLATGTMHYVADVPHLTSRPAAPRPASGRSPSRNPGRPTGGGWAGTRRRRQPRVGSQPPRRPA